MKTLSIDVRPAAPDDAAALSDAHRQAWQYCYSGLIPHKPLSRMLERRDTAWWRKATHGGAIVLVVDIGDTIAGYATLGLNRARTLPYDGEIYEIYMRPEYQGVGLGHVLFNECRRSLKSLGYRGMVAWCLEDCGSAVNFFSSNGGVDLVEGVEDFDGVGLKKLGFIWRR
ncbi:GNAT superfamily N-acetyltransferase [Agrobacterium vitis]|nr:GNAT superfamily N-acetyltransferase [Agrobacterium vitis]MBE1438991.1 GNAT superfamily N-acetyltransferase [Agrobacterium vitis]